MSHSHISLIRITKVWAVLFLLIVCWNHIAQQYVEKMILDPVRKLSQHYSRWSMENVLTTLTALHQSTAASTWWCGPRPQSGWIEMAVGLPEGPSYSGHSPTFFRYAAP